MSGEHRVKFTFTAPQPLSGNPDSVDERYFDVWRDKKGTCAREVFIRSDGREFPSNAWTSIAGGTLRDLKAEFEREFKERAAIRDKTIVEDRKAEALRQEHLAAFEPVKELVLEAFEVQEGRVYGDNWLRTVWLDVGALVGKELAEELTPLLSGDRKRALIATRRILRPLLSDAKANAREEYPEDYKEAEDKEEFYEQYLDEIVTHIKDSYA